MTKKEFIKKVKDQIKEQGCKVVDMEILTFESVFSDNKLYHTYVLAISNHVLYKYRAYQNEDMTTITLKFIGILGL